MLPTSGEDSVDGPRQDLLEPPFDELQASSDSHDSSSVTNPEHDQSSHASAASLSSQDEDGN